jgi:hypothetical protein
MLLYPTLANIEISVIVIPGILFFDAITVKMIVATINLELAVLGMVNSPNCAREINSSNISMELDWILPFSSDGHLMRPSRPSR